MRDGPAAGLALIDAILGRGDLADYHLAHSARAEMCRRLGRADDARRSYERALALAKQEPERRFLERRLAEQDQPPVPGQIAEFPHRRLGPPFDRLGRRDHGRILVRRQLRDPVEVVVDGRNRRRRHRRDQRGV